MRFGVRVGKEFELTDVEVIRAHRELAEENTRRFIVVLIFVTGIGFLVGAGILGLIEGEFAKLNAVWVAASAPLSAIVGYHFRSKERPNGGYG